MDIEYENLSDAERDITDYSDHYGEDSTFIIDTNGILSPYSVTFNKPWPVFPPADPFVVRN